MTKDLNLVTEMGSFKDPKTQEEITYQSFFVTINGIRVALVPKDSTGKQLIKQYFDNLAEIKK